MKKVIVFVVSTIACFITATTAQSNTNSVRHLVQKPVAVAKLSKVGYPDPELKKLSETLNQAGISPVSFNTLLGSIPYFAGAMNNINGPVNYVVLQHERGKSEDEIVTSVRDEVVEQDFPWKTRLPEKNEYLAVSTRNIIERVIKSTNERRGREEGEPEMKPPPNSPGQGGGGRPTPPRSPTGRNRPF